MARLTPWSVASSSPLLTSIPLSRPALRVALQSVGSVDISESDEQVRHVPPVAVQRLVEPAVREVGQGDNCVANPLRPHDRFERGRVIDQRQG